MKQTVYIETSIVGYLTARPARDVIVLANQQLTREWWAQRRQDFELYTSALVVQEARAGDSTAAQVRLAALEDITVLAITEAAQQLAGHLLAAGAVPKVAAEDALHIALAVAQRLDYLLTWNCRHIANATKRTEIDAVCRENGYEPIILCTPAELL